MLCMYAGSQQTRTNSGMDGREQALLGSNQAAQLQRLTASRVWVWGNAGGKTGEIGAGQPMDPVVGD